jgi:superfamily II RNA helicase
VYTDYRPTPLQHYIYPAGGDGLYLVVDEKGKFRDSSFQKAVNALSTNEGGDGNKKENGKWQKGGKGGAGIGENSDIFKIVKMIMLRQFDPVIVFSFSKRNCEENALKLFCLPNLATVKEFCKVFGSFLCRSAFQFLPGRLYHLCVLICNQMFDESNEL